jgi:hypothetical protein
LRANETSLQSQRIVFTRAYRDPGDRETVAAGYYRTLVTELARMPGPMRPRCRCITRRTSGHGAVPTDYHYTRADGVTPLDATVLTEFVSPGFFDLFRLPRLQGRDVSWDDGRGSPPLRWSRRPWLARCSRQATPSASRFGSPDRSVVTSK